MDQVLSVLHAMCEKVDSPKSLMVSILARSGEWLQLQELKVSPHAYLDAESYWRDAVVVNLLRKCKLPLGKNTAAAAVKVFIENEHRCARTNMMVKRISRNGPMDHGDVSTSEILSVWKEKVRLLIGKPPTTLCPEFSGGATTSTASKYSSILDKMSTVPHWYKQTAESNRFFDFYDTLWGAAVWDADLLPVTIRGNIFFTVFKDSEKDRGCAKEALIPVTLQLAAAKQLRNRLLWAAGIDLKNDAVKHQMLAREGSITNALATHDQSSASDLWARELVRFLLPPKWREVLDSLRATHTRVGDKWVYLEKYSSMGNGFTFELETILFYTLALVACERVGITGTVSCYGDDLIVPSEASEELTRLLLLFGHQPNARKTFSEGYFRESCGGDYFAGVEVNTFSLESLPEEPQHWMSLANNLRRITAGNESRWSLISSAWRAALSHLPRQIRDCYGPQHLGDQVIHGPEKLWRLKTSSPGNGHEPRRLVRAYVAATEITPLSVFKHPSSVLAYATTLGASSRGVGRRVSPSYRLRWVDADPSSKWEPGPKSGRYPGTWSPSKMVGPVI